VRAPAPADRADVFAVAPVRATVLPVAGRGAGDRPALDALAGFRGAELAVDFDGVARLAPLRAAEVLLAVFAVDFIPVVARFAEAVFFDALPAAAAFAGAPRAAEVLVAAALPLAAADARPAVLLAGALLPVDAFLATGLLAPVFLVADLRGLVVAMRLSRRMGRAAVAAHLR
jgi:hypothetical protein